MIIAAAAVAIIIACLPRRNTRRIRHNKHQQHLNLRQHHSRYFCVFLSLFCYYYSSSNNKSNSRRSNHLFVSSTSTIACCPNTINNYIQSIIVDKFQQLSQKSKSNNNTWYLNKSTNNIGNIYYGIPQSIVDETFRSWHHKKDDGTANNKDNENNEYDVDQIMNEEMDPIILAKRKYYQDYESISTEVEEWALNLIKEDNTKENGWTEIFCSKACSKFNSHRNTHYHTRQYVKWMPDSRGPHYVDLNQDPRQQLHPCMLLYGTIHAPYEVVCAYLSQKQHLRDYNSMIIEQQDLEVLTSYSKICWSQSKKIFFIEPRDFITYCRHRWIGSNNGNAKTNSNCCDIQFITNQALTDEQCNKIDHDVDEDTTTNSNNNDETVDTNNNDLPDTDTDTDVEATTTTTLNNKYRAYSLRGATLLSKAAPANNIDTTNNTNDDDEDKKTERTNIILLSHCNCGTDMPEWVVRTAVNLSAPIKPFEIIHRINVGIEQEMKLLAAQTQTKTNTATTTTTTASVAKQPEQDLLDSDRCDTIQHEGQQEKEHTHKTSVDVSSSSTSTLPKYDIYQRRKRRTSSRPAGIAQMGYGAFWPEGGGLIDNNDDADADEEEENSTNDDDTNNTDKKR